MNQNENDAFLDAVENEQFEVVIFLLDNGANIHTDSDWALIGNIENISLKMIKLLVHYGIDIHATDGLSEEDFTPGPDLDAFFSRNKKNDWALYWSIKRRRYEIVNYLLTLYSVEEIKKAFSNEDLKDVLLKYVMKNDLSKYGNVISAFRELGIDIYDLVESEL